MLRGIQRQNVAMHDEGRHWRWDVSPYTSYSIILLLSTVSQISMMTDDSYKGAERSRWKRLASHLHLKIGFGLMWLFNQGNLNSLGNVEWFCSEIDITRQLFHTFPKIHFCHFLFRDDKSAVWVEIGLCEVKSRG